MPDDEQDTNDPDNVGGDSDGTTTQPTEGDKAKAESPKEPSDGQEKVQQVKHSDFKRIKDAEREKGRREALSDLDKQAIAAGFASHSDALKALAELKKTPAKPAEPTPPKETNAMSSTEKDKMKAAKEKERQAAEAQRLADEKQRAADRKAWRESERKRRELQSQLDAKDAEMGLREEMYRSGVSDVDYTIRLLTRQLEGKTQEEIAAFDRNAFYEGLKKERPYLFGEKVAPANTGTNGVKPDGSKPPEPKPGESAKDAAADNQFDARKAKPDEVQARLRALGLNPHM